MAKTGDLRAWLKEVDKIGELVRIDGADWNLEIGAIAGLNRKRDAPSLLFDNIKGYPKGYRVVCSAHMTPTRMCLTLGLPLCHSDAELAEILQEKFPEWSTRAKEFPPQLVDSGPVLENSQSGKKVNLLKFPAPKWHEQDGARYIGTGHVVITQDPDSGEINLGTYRVMLHDKKTTGLFMGPGRHGRRHIEKYHERGQPAPVAVSLGHHPLILGVGCTPIIEPEYNFAGAVRGKPIKVIKEEITGLPIPADSEIVLAGWCPPGVTRMEGPFGEWTGYATKERLAPMIEVERVYHRDEPILLGAPPNRPPTDNTHFSLVIRNALLFNELKRSGIPDIKAVSFVDAVGNNPIIVVSIKQRYAGHAKQVALAVAASQVGSYHNKYIIVVDEDIDPTNINDVLWAIAMRTDPVNSIDMIRETRSSGLNPLIRRPAKAFVTSKAIINACKPYEWMDEFPKEIKASPELEDQVKQRWGKLLKL